MPVSAVTAGNVVVNDVAVCVGARCTDAAYRCCVQMLRTLLTCAVALYVRDDGACTMYIS